jgi:hypothetical protein
MSNTMLPFKFPKTYHFPYSQSVAEDDIVVPHLFEGKEVIATRKMDGESFTGSRYGCHARSPDGRNHPSRDWAKAFWAERSWKLNDNWRITCENMYAQHSLTYTDLPGYLLGFAAWDENLTCLSWDDTTTLMKSLDIPMVDVLWRGVWNEKKIKSLWKKGDEKIHEGYVVRTTDSFSFTDFKNNVRKFVRKNHVQTDTHWMHAKIVPNGLKP